MSFHPSPIPLDISLHYIPALIKSRPTLQRCYREMPQRHGHQGVMCSRSYRAHVISPGPHKTILLTWSTTHGAIVAAAEPAPRKCHHTTGTWGRAVSCGCGRTDALRRRFYSRRERVRDPGTCIGGHESSTYRATKWEGTGRPRACALRLARAPSTTPSLAFSQLSTLRCALLPPPFIFSTVPLLSFAYSSLPSPLPFYYPARAFASCAQPLPLISLTEKLLPNRRCRSTDRQNSD